VATQLAPTETATASPTATPSETPSPTATPTSTISPPLTPTATATVAETATVEPSATPTRTLEPTSTTTQEPTSTGTSEPSPTPEPTPTPGTTEGQGWLPAAAQLSETPADTPTPTPTWTETTLPAATDTPLPSETPVPTSTPTSTELPSPTPSASATATPTSSPTPGPVDATFVYDGDGSRVLGSINGVTTVYVGDHYEIEGTTIRKYYTAGGQRIAMREDGTLYWLLTDHLGSTAVTVDEDGTKVSEQRYKAFGETRHASGDSPTTFGYTGQRKEPGIGLYYYRARWYDPALGRFVQADSLVPGVGSPQALDRYAYGFGNPLKYTDPNGNVPWLPLVALFFFIVTNIPGDTGPYEVSTANQVAGDVALRVAIEPYDWARTAQECLGSGCSWTDVALSAAPFIPGGVRKAGELASALRQTDDAIDLVRAGAGNMAQVRAAGRVGEEAAGIVPNTRRIGSSSGSADYRIPDQLLDEEKLLSEVKNVEYLPYTSQLRDFAAYADETGYTFELWVRSTTRLSAPLREAVESGRILRRILVVAE